MYSDSSRHTISLCRDPHDSRTVTCRELKTDTGSSGSPPYLSVELDRQDGVGVRVVADLGSLFEVADFELPGRLQAHDGHQAAGEETLHDANVLRVRCRETQQPFILRDPCGNYLMLLRANRTISK